MGRIIIWKWCRNKDCWSFQTKVINIFLRTQWTWMTFSKGYSDMCCIWLVNLSIYTHSTCLDLLYVFIFYTESKKSLETEKCEFIHETYKRPVSKRVATRKTTSRGGKERMKKETFHQPDSNFCPSSHLADEVCGVCMGRYIIITICNLQCLK